MKKLYTLWLAALAMIMSCNNESDTPVIDNPDSLSEVVITAEQTRTHLSADESHAEWDASDEYIMVYRGMGTTTDVVRSDEGSIVGGLATFRASFSNRNATEYRYNAIYPAGAVTNQSSNNIEALPLTLNAEQQPSTTSYDCGADIMVAREVVTTSSQSSLSMRFTRVVALGKMEVKGLPSGADIEQVVFTVDGKPIAGECTLNCAEATIVAASDAVKSVTVVYENPVTSITPIYFMLFPTSLGQGDSFVVTVTADGKNYTREIVVPNGRSLDFTAGNMSSFTIDMTGVKPEGGELPSQGMAALAGVWHIAEYRGSTDIDFDIYLSITADGGVTLWQRLDEHGWVKYISSANYNSGVVSGVYNDGVAWGASYYCTLSAERMTWVDTLDSSDVTVYERVDALPDTLPLSDTRTNDFVVRYL